MKTATISDFKAHISEHLREVRAGQHFLILDRSTAIAEVSPVQVRPRPVDLQPRTKFAIPEAPVLTVSTNANDLLALERGDR